MPIHNKDVFWAVIPGRKVVHAFYRSGNKNRKFSGICGQTSEYLLDNLTESDSLKRGKCTECEIVLVTGICRMIEKFFMGIVLPETRKK